MMQVLQHRRNVVGCNVAKDEYTWPHKSYHS